MENGNMNEKICLAHGASSGIGKVTAKALAAGVTTMIMVYRNRDKCEAARDEIVRDTSNENAALMIAEFSEPSQIRRLAAGVNRPSEDRPGQTLNYSCAFAEIRASVFPRRRSRTSIRQCDFAAKTAPAAPPRV
jgi:NAD(P)-dependent dehydrogenase (short-subunit alcohol dehydrogenase family)